MGRGGAVTKPHDYSLLQSWRREGEGCYIIASRSVTLDEVPELSLATPDRPLQPLTTPCSPQQNPYRLLQPLAATSPPLTNPLPPVASP